MEKILRRVYSSKKISTSLKIISHASVLVCIASYMAVLVFSYLESPLTALKILIFSAVPYVVVSLARKIINAPRPYELYDFYEIKPKDKKGHSFPSRHVFSAFSVATFAYITSVWLSIALAVVGVCLAVSRVLLGMHFTRDVCAGSLIGILSGVIGLIAII